MSTAPVARVVAAGLTRRRRPAIVIGLVLAISAAAGCIAGVLVGNLLARPLLAGAAYVFGPGVLGGARLGRR
jgi:hypothetical protein